MGSEINKAKRQAFAEKSLDKVEKDLEKYAYMVSTMPEQEWQYLISADPSYAGKPAGLKYLIMRLKEVSGGPQPEFTPGQAQAGQQGMASFFQPGGAVGGMRGAAPPAIQPGLAKTATQYMPGMQERYRPTGATAEEEATFYEAMKRMGVEKPATKAEQAQTLVTGGAFRPKEKREEISSNYKQWLAGAKQKYYDIPTTNYERGLAGRLTMGKQALSNEGLDMQDLLFEYENLENNSDLLDSLGVKYKMKKGKIVDGSVDWENWNHTEFEAKGWREKLSTFFMLLDAIPALDEKAQDWIFFNWIGGGLEEPGRATQTGGWQDALLRGNLKTAMG